MKRYFIFGFLSILIITLNFAFIIALVKDDLQVNYSILFLLWAVVIIAAAGFAFLESRRKRKAADRLLEEKIITEDPLKPKPEEVSPSLIYKNKSLRKFRISVSDDFNEKLKKGFFGGYIVTEEYAQEIVQAVYTNEKQLLGFISQKEDQLRHNLEHLYKEPLICWGTLNWNEELNHFIVKGHVPVLYSEPELNRFKKLITLKTELLTLEAAEEVDTANYLKKAENFSFLEQSVVTPSSLDHSINPEQLVAYSKALVESQDWQKVREIEEYPILISRLKQPYKKEVQSAIKKAARKMEE